MKNLAFFLLVAAAVCLLGGNAQASTVPTKGTVVWDPLPNGSDWYLAAAKKIGPKPFLDLENRPSESWVWQTEWGNPGSTGIILPIIFRRPSGDVAGKLTIGGTTFNKIVELRMTDSPEVAGYNFTCSSATGVPACVVDSGVAEDVAGADIFPSGWQSFPVGDIEAIAHIECSFSAGDHQYKFVYDTGPPNVVQQNSDGAYLYGGYISGYVNSSQPKRYTATGFQLTTNETIDHVKAYYFTNEENSSLIAFQTLGYHLYNEASGGGPDVNSIVAEGTLAVSGNVDTSFEKYVDAFNYTTATGIRVAEFDLNAPVALNAGTTYWLSIHGQEGALAWYTGAIDGWETMYRATTGDNYSLYTNTVWNTNGDDPARVYHCSFKLGYRENLPPQEETVYPNDAQVLKGTYNSGDNTSFTADDDNYYVVGAQYDPTDPLAVINATVRLSGNAAASSYTSGRFVIIEKCNTTQAKYRIRANKAAGGFATLVDGVATSFSETTFDNALPGAVSDFIDAANGNKMTVDTRAASNNKLAGFFRYSIELAKWVLTP